MLTFLRKSSSVSSFLLPAIGLHGVQSFLYERPFVLKDSLICFADRGKGEWDWYVRGDLRFMNFTTFCLIFIIIFFLDNGFFFNHDIYPGTHTHTHDPRHLATLSARTWERVGERTWVESVSVGVGKCRGKNVSHKNKK